MNEDESTFEIPDYILSRLQPTLTLGHPAREDDHRSGDLPDRGHRHRRHGRQRRAWPDRRQGAGLDDDRPALRRAGDVHGTADRKLLALMVQHVHPRGVHEDAAGLVAEEGVVGEAVPEAGDDVEGAGRKARFRGQPGEGKGRQ